MATALTLPLVPVDEYLNTSYRPDMEYVDGVLVERSMPTIPHGLLQFILGSHFRPLEQQYRFKVLPEIRTEIIERARYRIPDVLLCAKPIPSGRIMNITPFTVIEVLSPEDKFTETLSRFRDYEGIGVKTIVEMDPERYVAYRYEAGSLLETRFQSLYLPHMDVLMPFDSEALFEQLRAELADAMQTPID